MCRKRFSSIANAKRWWIYGAQNDCLMNLYDWKTIHFVVVKKGENCSLNLGNLPLSSFSITTTWFCVNSVGTSTLSAQRKLSDMNLKMELNWIPLDRHLFTSVFLTHFSIGFVVTLIYAHSHTRIETRANEHLPMMTVVVKRENWTMSHDVSTSKLACWYCSRLDSHSIGHWNEWKMDTIL